VGRPARKMVNLAIEETSGVDHPAHLHEGWLVMKAANKDEVDNLADQEVNMPKIEKAEEEPTYEEMKAALAKANAKIEEMQKEMDEMKKPKKDEEESKGDLPEFLQKEAPAEVRKAFEEMQKSIDEAKAQAEAAEMELRKEKAERADAEAVVKARESYANLGLDAEMVGPALRRLDEADAELAKSISEILTSANAKVESADIFSEIGKSANQDMGSAYEKATSMAKAAVADGRAATVEQALSEVFLSDADLYSSYLAEQGK